MESLWSYPFPPLFAGTLIKRYKRFLADIELDSGELITAHCPNTGPMTGICFVGGRVQVSHHSDPKRKLAYTWEMAEVTGAKPTWVGVNTALPNRVVKAALQAQIFSQLGPFSKVRAEAPYGQDKKSRIDFLLTHDSEASSIYVEVKNTTWAKGSLALFPDTVTTRGQKHLRELINVRPNARAVMLYFINRGDCSEFSPGDDADPEYGKLLRHAIAQGVEILPCRFEVTPNQISYLGLAKLKC